MKITLSNKAIKKILEVAEIENHDQIMVRVEAKMIGLKKKYQLKFVSDQETTNHDKTFQFANKKVKIIADKRQFDLLNGLKIDYVRRGDQEGFKMEFPLAAATSKVVG